MQRFGSMIYMDLQVMHAYGANEIGENESLSLTNPRMLCQDLPRLCFAITT